MIAWIVSITSNIFLIINLTISLKKAIIHGSIYEIGTVVVTEMSGIEKKFGKIIRIWTNEGQIHFEFEEFEEFTYDDHYRAYIVEETGVYKSIMHRDLPNIPPCLSIIENNTHFMHTHFKL